MRTIRARLPHAQVLVVRCLTTLLLCCVLLSVAFSAIAAVPAHSPAAGRAAATHAALALAPQLFCPGSPLPC